MKKYSEMLGELILLLLTVFSAWYCVTNGISTVSAAPAPGFCSNECKEATDFLQCNTGFFQKWRYTDCRLCQSNTGLCWEGDSRVCLTTEMFQALTFGQGFPVCPCDPGIVTVEATDVTEGTWVVSSTIRVWKCFI